MRVRFTIRRLMALVGLFAIALALFRVHPSLTALAAGVSSMVLIRTCEKIDRSRSAGRSMGLLELVETCLDSVVVAVSILGASLLPAVCIIPICGQAMSLVTGLDDTVVMGIVLSAFLGIPIAYFLRRKMW
jgi:hypothetical protein